MENINLLPSLIVAALTYKINLIDKREYNNFEKFKNWLKRQDKIGRSGDGFYEQDEWLEKDILYILLAMYDEAKSRAILDYYVDYKDNQGTRNSLIFLIILNVLAVLGTGIQYPGNLSLLQPFGLGWLMLISIWFCFKGQVSTLFNNKMINPENSEKIKMVLIEAQYKIEEEISKLKQKYIIKGR